MPNQASIAGHFRERHVATWLLYGLAFYLFARMLMVFPPGRPQPADFLLAGLFALALRPQNVQLLQRIQPAYFWFVAWVVTVNTGWALFRGTYEYMIHATFQVFNFGLFGLVLWARTRQPIRFDWLVSRAAMAAALAQLAIVLGSGRAFRAIGSFKNTNQLAYWCLCILALYLVTQRKRTLWDLLVVLPAAWIEVYSTSRAGLVGMAVLVSVWLYELLHKSQYRVLYGFGIIASLSLLTTLPAIGDYLFELEIADHLEYRFTKESAVDEVGLRNTDRISHYPEYAFVGAGEGDLERFPYTLQIEIHSTPMTIIFSYGIIGVLAFGSFITTLAQRLPPSQRLTVASLFIYSIGHNGMRFAFFWFALAVLSAEPWAAAAYAQTPATTPARKRAGALVTQ